MDNINFKKVLDDGELFEQQANYEDNFEKINQLVVPKITDLETNKVDKETGKGLSTNDFDNTYKQKIDVDIPAQLNDIENDFNAQLADIEQDKAEKTDVGLLSGLLTTAKTSIVNAINELFNSKANKAQEAWITPTLTSGWLNYGAPLSVAGYYKNEFKEVSVKGVVKGTLTGGGNPIFTLPTGYRPNENLYFVVANDGGSVWVIINTAGLVYVLGALKSTWLSLDNIKFRVV